MYRGDPHCKTAAKALGGSTPTKPFGGEWKPMTRFPPTSKVQAEKANDWIRSSSANRSMGTRS